MMERNAGHDVDHVIWEETDFLNFEDSIEAAEMKGLGVKDGVFKVTIDPEESHGTPHPEVLSRIMQRLRTLGKQELLASARGGEKIYHYNRKLATHNEKKLFLAAASNSSSFTNDTCCLKILNEGGVQQLIDKHLFEDIYPQKCVIGRTDTQCAENDKLNAKLLSNAAQDLKCYQIMKENNTPCPPRKGTYLCKCCDCVDVSHSAQDDPNCVSGKECGESDSLTNGVYYGDGIFLEKDDKPIMMTKNFGLKSIVTILVLVKTFYEELHSPGFYIASPHSFFPLHIEDCALWSLNHHIMGHPKIWIIIPPRALLLLQYHLQRSGMTLGHTSCRNILLHKVVVTTPKWLAERRIPYKVVVQKPGDILILYPNSAHFGFNAGWCVNQAINFASKSWILSGINAERCICYDKPVHLDLGPLVAAFMPELLHAYQRKQPVPASPQFNEMVEFMQSAVNDLSSQYPSANKSHLHQDQRIAGQKTKMKILLHCPVKVCQETYVKQHLKRLITHVRNKHKALLVKYKLIDKINAQLSRK